MEEKKSRKGSITAVALVTKATREKLRLEKSPYKDPGGSIWEAKACAGHFSKCAAPSFKWETGKLKLKLKLLKNKTKLKQPSKGERRMADSGPRPWGTAFFFLVLPSWEAVRSGPFGKWRDGISHMAVRTVTGVDPHHVPFAAPH